MRLALVVLLPLTVVLGSAACAREAQPPRICEPPPPTKRDVRIGTCPIDWGHDAGTDALDSGPPDAPADG